jgi:hypothetical protein
LEQVDQIVVQGSDNLPAGCPNTKQPASGRPLGLQITFDSEGTSVPGTSDEQRGKPLSAVNGSQPNG